MKSKQKIVTTSVMTTTTAIKKMNENDDDDDDDHHNDKSVSTLMILFSISRQTAVEALRKSGGSVQKAGVQKT
jgi:hypothetical protein